MKTMNDWRLTEAATEQKGEGDFEWLRYFFGKVRDTPPGSMINTLKPKVEQLKNDFAKLASHVSSPDFSKDVPAELAKGFTIQMMATVIKLLLPDDYGQEISMNTKSLKSFMGDEGDDFTYLRKVLGKSRVLAPTNMMSGLRAQVIRLKNDFSQKYGIHDWQAGPPHVKSFVLDMLAAVLKTVFSSSDASGGGRGINYQKVGKFAEKPQPTTTEPDQSTQPTKGTQV